MARADAAAKPLSLARPSARLTSVVVETFDQLVAQVRACAACAAELPLGARPVIQVSPTARLLIASQAPGSKVHASGRPFDDASGDRLRDWMGIDAVTFYDAARVATLPMAFCYPGRAAGGDRPPPRACAARWRESLLAAMPEVRLTLLVGSYAQAHVLGPGALTPRVANYRAYGPALFPLPHPSWRSQLWMRRNPWFEAEVLPALRATVAAALR
ncbi:uracil-DNA glycosylase family protein [Sphingomonas sp. RRHST34]|uniref:Uracil-DNA glycosylase family protein n=1 Tax=Sphingomonas citri TaxID=2862499 RepID=A0ABS7BMW2_9SPHN|nr:uracil-DNA glycosylase family protein [Sphingomonas citri]MBW6530949.1 uracil-DNA glycosylase family protein [Sphingomonas citri]